MNGTDFFPEKVFVVKDCLGQPMTERILKRLAHVPMDVISDEREAHEDLLICRDPLSKGKKRLLLTEQKGEYVKPCPCTPRHIGCNYYIINADVQCPMDCSYCILQAYLASPIVTVHVNIGEMERQIVTFLKDNPRPLRIGTGELGDSLALDHITDRSLDMIACFKNKKMALFELKTKTVNIDNLMKNDPPDNVVIAWSLNAEKIASSEEKGAPSVIERIKAAAHVSKKGYYVAFHFDPLILFPGWKDGYHEVIAELMAQIDRRKIAWISLGALRFAPLLKPVIKQRFPESKIIYGELIKGRDGKFRYFKPVRLELFRHIVGIFRKEGGEGLPLYFCMETEEIWQEILQKKPRSKEDVEKYLSLPRGYG
jgi:spore photoproduct lyase